MKQLIKKNSSSKSFINIVDIFNGEENTSLYAKSLKFADIFLF